MIMPDGQKSPEIIKFLNNNKLCGYFGDRRKSEKNIFKKVKLLLTTMKQWVIFCIATYGRLRFSNVAILGCFLPILGPRIYYAALLFCLSGIGVSGSQESGRVVSPRPKARCMVTESTQRPNLNPTDGCTPIVSNPSLLCRPMDASLAESPIMAIIWR